MTLSQELINEFVAASHFDFPKVRQMLAETPALLNENAEWIETPVQAAAHVGNVDIATFLLDQGAPLDICTAAMLGREADVDAILAEDAEMIRARGAHNTPLLYFAIIGGHLPLAQKLLAAGADINDGEGVNTPLHGAVQDNNIEAARWLLASDANPYALDFNGKTPLDLAEDRGYEDLVNLLRPYYETDEDGGGTAES